MNYTHQIGRALAETLNEIFLADDAGLALNEIRNPDRLRAEINRLSTMNDPQTKGIIARLKYLHDRKLATRQRQTEEGESISAKQQKLAKSYGYRKVSKGRYVHQDSGHELRLNADNSWSHLKSGGKYAKKGRTPFQALRSYLSKTQESVEVGESEELQEIRRTDVLAGEINKLSGKNDPESQQRLPRLRALKLRQDASNQRKLVPKAPALSRKSKMSGLGTNIT